MIKDRPAHVRHVGIGESDFGGLSAESPVWQRSASISRNLVPQRPPVVHNDPKGEIEKEACHYSRSESIDKPNMTTPKNLSAVTLPSMDEIRDPISTSFRV